MICLQPLPKEANGRSLQWKYFFKRFSGNLFWNFVLVNFWKSRRHLGKWLKNYCWLLLTNHLSNSKLKKCIYVIITKRITKDCSHCSMVEFHGHFHFRWAIFTFPFPFVENNVVSLDWYGLTLNANFGLCDKHSKCAK